MMSAVVNTIADTNPDAADSASANAPLNQMNQISTDLTAWVGLSLESKSKIAGGPLAATAPLSTPEKKPAPIIVELRS